ncbi:MAG TPA: hypothetical protein VIK57_18475 [Streptosporangiaceae bacterium]
MPAPPAPRRPNGTSAGNAPGPTAPPTVTLYQEANHVSASGKIADTDPRRFTLDYADNDPQQLDTQLAEFTRRIDDLDAARAGRTQQRV